MKKLLLSVFALVILGLPKLSAQIINPNFETWSPDYLAPTAMDPNAGLGTSGWWDFNFFNYTLLGSSPVTVFQDSVNPAPISGKYCAKIISQPMVIQDWDTLKYYGLSFPDTNGIIYTAFYNARTRIIVKNGIPCTNKLTSLSFWYRYIPNGLDTCSCTIGMYHFDTMTKQRVLIGGGRWNNTSMVTNWTSATVPIAYDSATLMPDTIIVMFSACSVYSHPKVNDTMNIDSITTTMATGINAIVNKNVQVTAYPNPANSQINLLVTGPPTTGQVEVFDMSGKVIGSYVLHNNQLTINTQQYSSGLYFYKIYDNRGVQINVGKFSMVK